MFIQTWNKYLPVIRILLKRSVNEVQTLDMNQIDFLKAAGGKKAKFTFSMLLINGRFSGIKNPSPLAQDLITVLQQDDAINKFLKANKLELTMNTSSQLIIKNITPAEESSQSTDETNQVTGNRTS
jgi:hypothetical protein